MDFKLYHACITVLDLEKSIKFYEDALNLKEINRITYPDGSAIMCFLGNSESACALELAWYRDRAVSYDLGDNKTHLGFSTSDIDSAYRKHKEMGIVCQEKPEKKIHFIKDPDEYIVEVLPKEYEL